METLLDKIRAASRAAEALDVMFDIVDAGWTPIPEDIVAIQSNLALLSKALDNAEEIVLKQEEETAKALELAKEAARYAVADIIIRVLASDNIINPTDISNYENLPVDTKRRLAIDLKARDL